ncbi:hypothetical protein GCM10027059_42810 [Myceligenerans halotolerans]
MTAVDNRVRAQPAARTQRAATSRASSPRRIAVALTPYIVVTRTAARRSLYPEPPTCATAAASPATRATSGGSGLPGRHRRRALHQAATTNSPARSVFTPRAA